MNLFITGSDTGVGKTYVTSLLLRSLRSCAINAVGMKPIETGEGTDAQCLHATVDGCIPLELVNPIRFKLPVAPAIAAEREGHPISRDLIFFSYERLSALHSCVLVEGAGGWRVPISEGYDVADLARDLSAIAPLQVLVVALDRLGVINHTLLTIESIRAYGLNCAGFVLNKGPARRIAESEASTHAQWITRGSQVPVWFEIQSGQVLLSKQDMNYFLKQTKNKSNADYEPAVAF
jgi:dethiobiotin synthetase